MLSQEMQLFNWNTILFVFWCTPAWHQYVYMYVYSMYCECNISIAVMSLVYMFDLHFLILPLYWWSEWINDLTLTWLTQYLENALMDFDHFYAPNFERSWRDILLSGRASVRDSVWPPSVTLFDACHILWTVHVRVLKFHIWIFHGKIADCDFFFLQVISLSGVMPLWKKTEWNPVSKISLKVFELGAWSLVSW